MTKRLGACIISTLSATGSLSRLIRFVNLGLDINHTDTIHGFSALHIACIYNQLQIVKFLVKMDASLLKDFNDLTALDYVKT